MKKKILIVEDDENLVEMYKEKLKLEGFSVKVALDGKKALAKISQKPDLILLDILMPGLNGFEVLKRIKANRELDEIPVIVLTNVGSESFDSDKNLAISLGAVDYMIKSHNTPQDVVNRVNAILA